jgi:Arc/MetJ-type ribon-helix-helix transcriptional regulator
MTTKLAISLPDELAEQVRAAVRAGRAPSVSAYIASAIEALRDAPTLDQVLAEMEAEFGPIPAEVQAWAEAQFDSFDAPANGPEPTE